MEEKPLGSDLAEVIEADRPQESLLPLRWLLLVVGVVVFLFCSLLPNFLKARARGQLTACKSNLKNIATALEMYASDNTGQYPKSLDGLFPKSYLRRIPSCPSSGTDHDYTYEVTTKPDNFSMTCKGDHANAYKGFNADPHGFPQYHSEQGLLDHP